MRSPQLQRALAIDPRGLCLMTQLAAAFYSEAQRPETVLKPNTRIDAPRIQATLEMVLEGVLRERDERPFRIGSIDELEALGYGFSPEECAGGRVLFARDVGICLDEMTLRRERDVRWQLVLHGRFWR